MVFLRVVLSGLLVLLGTTVQSQRLITWLDSDQSEIIHFEFSPDSKYLVALTADLDVQVLDITLKTDHLRLPSDNQKYKFVGFSADSKNLVCASRNRITVIDLESKSIIKRWTNFNNVQECFMGYTPDQMFLVGKLSVWDPNHPNKLLEFNFMKGNYSLVADARDFSLYAPTPDAEGIVFAEGSSLEVYDFKSKTTMVNEGHDSKIRWISADTETNNVFSFAEGELRTWDYKNNQSQHFEVLPLPFLEIGPGGEYYAWSEGNMLSFKAIQAEWGNKMITGQTGLRDFAFSQTGDMIGTTSELSSLVRIWTNPWETRDQTSGSVAESPVPQPVEIANAKDGEINDKMIYGLYKAEIERDLALKAHLFNPKDEFEKTSDYQARLAEGQEYKVSIYAHYRGIHEQEIQFQKYLDSLDRARRQLLLEDKIKNSYQPVVFNLEGIGTYNADEEYFPVTVNGQEGVLPIPIAEARSFKTNYTKVLVRGARQLNRDGSKEEIFNLTVVHPITLSEYPFGPQRDALFVDPQNTELQQLSTVTMTDVPQITPTEVEVLDSRVNELFLQEIRKRKNYALIIGVQDYDNDEVSDLSYPLIDANNLNKVLREKYTFDPESIFYLKNPGRSEIVDAFDRMTRTVKPEDNLLIFYAGHGYWDEQLEQGYWLPRDARKASKAEWLSNGTIRDYIRGIDSKHTLLIADACFSGGIFRTRDVFGFESKAALELYKLPSRKAMTSGAMKTVPDRSVFMKYLLKRLQENEQSVFSSSQLFGSFREAVISNSINSQVPQYGEIRLAGDEGGDFIFVTRP